MAQRVLKFASDVTVKDGTITAILSSESLDRDGDIIRQAGWELDRLTGPLPLMSCHNYDSLLSQIGEWQNLHVDPERKALVGNPVYFTGIGNAEADYGYELAKLGKATYSIGFIPLESQPIKGSRSGYEYLRMEPLEGSHVPIPAQPEARQLALKAFERRWRTLQREPGRPVRKWDSAYMGDPDGYGPLECRCIVPGCDDASQTSVNVCSEHLKHLVNAPAEPPGGEADEEAEAMIRAFTKRLRVKAGRQISAANMGKLHSAMQSLKDVHDANCSGDACPLDDDGDEAPPEERDKAHKAASEGDGSASGVTVSDSGTHGAFDGKHSHPHDGAGMHEDDDGLHEHAHSHDGDGNHGHSHDGVNFKTARDAAHKAEMSAADQNDLPDSAFAVISAGGSKDDSGRTTPRSLRHLPHHKADGSIDLPHLKRWKNALSRVSQTDLSAEDRAKAEKHLEAHAKAEGIGEDNADKGATQGHDPQALSSVFRKQLAEALEGLGGDD